MGPAKRLLIVGAISLLIALAALPIAGIALQPKWEEIGTPPLPAVRIMATAPDLILLTSNGDLYQNCGTNCWGPFTLPELPTKPLWIESECPHAEIPDLRGGVELKFECEVYGPTITYRAYALDANGIAYRWEEKGSEWGWAGPLVIGGAMGMLGLIIGTVVVALLSFNDLLAQLQHRAQRRRDEHERHERHTPDS